MSQAVLATSSLFQVSKVPQRICTIQSVTSNHAGGDFITVGDSRVPQKIRIDINAFHRQFI